LWQQDSSDKEKLFHDFYMMLRHKVSKYHSIFYLF